MCRFSTEIGPKSMIFGPPGYTVWTVFHGSSCFCENVKCKTCHFLSTPAHVFCTFSRVCHTFRISEMVENRVQNQ